MFTMLFTCLLNQSYGYLSLLPTFVSLQLPVPEIAKSFSEGIYCCFTITTLFSTMVYSLKCMCILSFILIGFCTSELHAHLCPYRNLWLDIYQYTEVPHYYSCVYVLCKMHTISFAYEQKALCKL